MQESPIAIAASTAVLRVMPYLSQVTERATRRANTLSPSQAGMLFMLTESPLRGSEIARRWGVSRAAVTEAAQRLETARLIHRSRDPGDQRSWLFRMTPKGRRALEEFGKVTSEALAEYVRRLPTRDQRALLDANSSFFELFSQTFH